MKAFMDDNFMLYNETAVHLFHAYAKEMPIFDYHCHLSPQEIYENRKFKNVTEVFLGGDHYKWRAMRGNGVDEAYITGDKSDYEKFQAWAATVPYLIGNPLYHWTHLELKRFFGVEEQLSPKTADAIWERCNALLAGEGYRPRDFIKRSNVKLIGTTDDPTSDLEFHKKITEIPNFETKVVPAFRPDQAVELQKGSFAAYIGQLSTAAGKEITSFAQLIAVLEERIAYFHENGCRIADHGLEGIPYGEATASQLEDIFVRALSGKAVSDAEAQAYKSAVIRACAKQYAALGWTMQLHSGALRNNNTRMFERLGPDTGRSPSHCPACWIPWNGRTACPRRSCIP